MTGLLALKRLRVMKAGQAAYDQAFHLGTNIIRGDNGSGKSTIADFIFFALGAEFDGWKDAARLCDEVQAEIVTSKGTLTVRRSIASKLEAAHVHFGDMASAAEAGLNGWERFTIRRTNETSISFSQLLFRSCEIPDAPSIGGSNVTAHQILRLMYSDQQTPSGKLFRFESFDTRDIREVVGDLLIGVNSYRIYEAQLAVRQLKNELQDKDGMYNATRAGLPNSEGLTTIASLDERLAAIATTQASLQGEIESVDTVIQSNQTTEFLAQREKMRRSLQSLSSNLADNERGIETLDYDLVELRSFLDYLEDQHARLVAASETAERLGDLEFRYCPSCLRPLALHDDGHCVVCGSEIDVDRQRSRYMEIRIDTELQVRETRQLLKDKEAEHENQSRLARDVRRLYRERVGEFASKYDVSNAPREAFLASRHREVGRLEREATHLEELRSVLVRLDQLSTERAALNDQIAALEANLSRWVSASLSRKRAAMEEISRIGTAILRSDLRRQEEFENPRQFTLDFADDAIRVDGKMNFAESSNVIAKNTAILSLFSAATLDTDFWHPRFVLMDNIEDKGMEQIRSHNFQKLIVERSREARLPHQVIFTTSMMNPELELDDLTIGPKYTRQSKALAVV